MIVPDGQESGDYHIVATVGSSVSDDTALTVTGPPDPAGISPDKDSVDLGGDEFARTVTVGGFGFVPQTSGRVSILDGAPGSGGTELVGIDVTITDSGIFQGAALVVPQTATAGDYHIVAVIGDITVDENALTVTGSGQPAMDIPANLASGTATVDTIPVSWDAVATPVAAESYVVRWAPTGTETWTERDPVTTNSDTVDGLTADGSYDIAVKAQATGHTDSEWSPAITADTTAA